MSLNENQEKAVRAVQGRVLVLAGAGSGKTRVIIHRIAHLIRDLGENPKSILGLTFTNKAAGEMRHRAQDLIGEAAKHLTLCTFHSFCMQILRKEIEKLGYTRTFSLYDERDIERLKKQDEGLLPRDLDVTLRAYNAVSFDHLITLTIQLFKKFPEVLDKYSFKYLMIDEYQDTNRDQFQLAELLAKKYQNLCVVGDDDQSIYGWRGAEVKNILEFKADQIIKLEQNYRSTSAILEAANAVIQHNKGRHGKKLWSTSTQIDPIEIFNAPTDVDEAAAVIDRLLRFKNQGYRWRDMAVLYRSNSLSRNFETALIQRKIPYEIFGGLEFNQRSEIKDVLAYLRVIANPLDQEALLRIINVPRRGISDAFLDLITQENRTRGIPLWNLLLEGKEVPKHPRANKGIAAFTELIQKAMQRFQNNSPAESLSWLIEEINYKKAIEEEVKSEKMRQFKWENVLECVNAIAGASSLQDFVANTTLAAQTFESKRKNDDKVHLMTLHSAKGLEFPICFLVGLEDGIIPHEKGMDQTGIEEERRLFYVGITRAQKLLTFSMARSRLKMGKAHPTNPSRFLFEIPKQLIKAIDYKIFV